jgi:hypothetical protein
MQSVAFDIFMLAVRPMLIVLMMMLSAIYVDAFSGEIADAREVHQSVFGDLLGLLHDNLNRKDQKVSLFLHLLSPAFH